MLKIFDPKSVYGGETTNWSVHEMHCSGSVYWQMMVTPSFCEQKKVFLHAWMEATP